MRNLVVAFIVFMNFQTLFAQSDARENKAIQSKNKHLKSNDCDIRSTIELVRLYKQANDSSSLKDLLESALECPLTHYFQRDHYLDLADLYYGEEQYHKSLELIRLYERTKGKVKTPHNPWPKVAEFMLAQKKALSYERLSLNDSAITVLTPFVFYKIDFFATFIDSSSYASVLNEYLRLLRKEYTDKHIIDELQKAERQFYYNHTVAGKGNGETHHKVVSGFKFFDSNIEYIDMEVWEFPNSLQGSYSSKVEQIEYLKTTPLFLTLHNL